MKSSSNTKKSKHGMKFAYAFLFIYLSGFVGFFSYQMITQLASIHQEAIFLGVFFLAIAVFVMFQAIFTTINVFYFSKDIEYVLPWPLSPKEILSAKLNVILITEYIMEFMIGLVPLILYGVITSAGIGYYLIAALVLLVFPILPLLIVSFFVMIIMSFAKLTKKRDTFQFIATLIIIIVVIAIQFIAGGSPRQEPTQEQMLEMLTKANGMVGMISDYFITLNPTINALTNANFLMSLVEVLKIVGMTLVGYVAFILLGQKLYLRGAVGNLVGGKTKNKKVNVEKAYRGQKIGVSYVKKELKILVRNPVFFLQCVLPALLMPILFFGVIVFSLGAEEKAQMLSFLPDMNSSLVIFIILGASQFLSMMIYVAATAISRDGLNATFVKYVPIPLYKQFRYKIIPNIIMQAISSFVITAMFFYMIPTTPILLLIAGFCISVIAGTIQSYFNFMVDLKRPKLEWTTEYAVVKQNMNLAFTIAFALTGLLITVLLGVVLANLPPIIVAILLVAVLGGVVYVLEQYVRKYEARLFEKIR